MSHTPGPGGPARLAGTRAGHAHPRPVLRPGLDLRAQVRRRALPRVRRRRAGAADDPQPADVNRTFPEIAEALDAQRRGGDFIVDGEIVAFDGDQTRFGRLQRRIGVIHPGADLLAGAGLLLPVRRAVGRRPRRPPLPLLRAQGAPARRCCPSTTRCASPSTGTPTARRTTARRAPRAGRASSPSAPTRLPQRAHPGLAEVQVRERAGVRHRRLHRPAALRIGFGALLLGYYDRGGGSSTRARSAPASTTRCCAACTTGWPRIERPRPAVDAGRCRPERARTGSSPSSSPRSASASGPATASCATPDSWACATTRTPRRGAGDPPQRGLGS